MSLNWLLQTLRQAPHSDMPPLPALWLPEGADAATPPLTQIIHCVERLANMPKQPPAGNLIYAMLPRHTTATYHEGKLYSGTLLRCIPLLFHLKRIGVGVVYLLPLFKMGRMALKGDIPSPYAISDFKALDESLHDSALGPYTKETLARTFAAFTQACHALGMRVMLDFVLRTCARDNDLIADHPDWFYYVRADKDFVPPYFADIKRPTAALPGLVRELKQTAGYRQFAAQFVHNPRKTDPERFGELMDQTGGSALLRLESGMNLTTAPAFCDVINDPQPPWSDVTYLRYELQDSGEPPCMFYDHIKLAHYPLIKPNAELMEYLGGVIPYYAREYKIDGARIDMGHALPEAWVRDIMAETRSIKRDFVFWCEQLDMSKSKDEKQKGYDLMSGTLFIDFLKRDAKSLARNLRRSHLPLCASAETPDTPRSAHKLGPQSAASALLFSLFLPNAYPMVNAGAELQAIQPLNLGLLSEESDRYALSKGDIAYGKLAFFDACAMDWAKPGITELISQAKSIADKWHNADKLLKVIPRNGQILMLRIRKNGETLRCYYNMGDVPYAIKRKSGSRVLLGHPSNCLEKTNILPPGGFAVVLNKNQL